MIKKCLLSGLCGLIIAVFSSSALSQQADNKESVGRANEILSQARKVVYGETKKVELRSLFLNTSSSDTNQNSVKIDNLEEAEKEGDDSGVSKSETASEISFEFPNKVRFHSSRKRSNRSVGSSIENFAILNAEKYKNDSKIFVDGKLFDVNKTKFPVLASIIGNNKSTSESESEKKEKFLYDFWLTIFPILLDVPWNSNYTFEYIGKAKSDDTSADIIQVKSQDARKIQLFFDEKTHLLLMMTVKNDIVKNEMSLNEDYKYFFSNYEDIGGILIAKKINIEGFTQANTNKSIMGYKVKGRNTKSNSEITIKGMKINPTFKPDTFFIADEKK